ncbi:MAG: winged helix-turn-helix transcriptional regulator [Firmicutes bacterium]|nr:winged helix-turn-helix transcriptional regulator [Bacillota bacterium]
MSKFSCISKLFDVELHYSIIEQWTVKTLGDNNFFKPTPLFKEYMILDLIEKNKNITQREISKTIGIAVSMVNDYLDDYEKKGLIKRKKHSSKTVEYFVTKNGKERIKVLNIGYLKASQNLYSSAKENIEQFLRQVEKNGFKNILLYGAGEVAEILLHTIQSSKTISINALAIIDDDSTKLSETIINLPIISLNQINQYNFDGILISSFKHHETIRNRLEFIGFPKSQIIKFFE